MKIAYPAGTTFNIVAANEYVPSYPPGPVTFSPVASLAQVQSNVNATSFYFDGGFLHLKVTSDFRANQPYFASAVTITATHPSLP